MKSLLLIGGSNIDIKAKSRQKLILKDSNIGDISYSCGGVSRNIAENLSHLGEDFSFLTAVGDDVNGKRLRENMESLRIQTHYIPSTYGTGTYLSIDDDNGDMAVAVCSSQIMDEMTEESLLPFASLIDSFDLISLDANLSPRCLSYLFEHFEKPFLVEGVSANKIVRFRPYLDKIHLLKCNLLEARYLLNMEQATSKEICNALFQIGMKNACITSSTDDIFFLQDGVISSLPVTKATHVVSTTGCGDAFYSGLLYGYRRDADLKKACALAREMSRITLECKAACNPDIVMALESNLK